MTESESKSIDAVRVTANFLVVLIHAWAAEQYCRAGCAVEYSLWDFLCNHATSASMSALFFMSGFLMMQGIDRGGASALRLKFARRVRRLFIPYLCWNALFVAFYLCASKFVPRMAERVKSFGLDTLAGAFSKVLSLTVNPIDMPTWYMRTVFVYFIVAWIVWIFARRIKIKSWGWGLIYAGILSWIVVSWLLGWGPMLKFTYPGYSLLAFAMGCHFSLCGKNPFKAFSSKWLVLLSVCGMAVLKYHSVAYHWDYHPMRDVGFLMAMPLLFLVGPLLSAFLGRLPFYWFIKKSSFFLYCGHFFFCSIVLHVLAPRFAYTGPGRLTALIVVFCFVGVPLIYGVYWLGARIGGRAFKCLDGSL